MLSRITSLIEMVRCLYTFINRLKELANNSARGLFSKCWRGCGSGRSAALISVPPLSSVERRLWKWRWRTLRSGSHSSSPKYSDPKRPQWGRRRAGRGTTCRWHLRSASPVRTQVGPRAGSGPEDREVRAAMPFADDHCLHPPQSLWQIRG